MALAYDPADQKRRRMRARIKLSEIARLLDISVGSLSQYENGKTALPHALTGDDYEVALAQGLLNARQGDAA